MGITCFQVNQIPDLSLNKYQSLADTGIAGVLKRHNSFLRQWHGICIEDALSFHLLYLYLPTEPVGQRMKVFFLIQGDKNGLQLVEPLLQKSPLSDFFVFEKGELPRIRFSAGTTLTKKERLADIPNPMTGQNKLVHYVPKWEMNEDARLYDFFRIMETIGQAYFPERECAFRIDLYPISTVEETRFKFNPVLKELRGENDIRLMRETNSLRDDNDARNICKEYEDWLTNIETAPHFRMNIYGFADNIFKAKVLLNAAGSEALSEGDFCIAPIKSDADGSFCLLSRMGVTADDYCYFRNHKEAVLKSWSTTYCLSEVVPFFRLPTLYDGETIEIPKETAPVRMKNGIYLGNDMNGYPVNFALEDFPRHAFFTGMPGSGKTNTMLHLVTQLRKKGIPFLALEPAKKEYRAILGAPEMWDVHLFSPHLQSLFPLQMNPLEFPVGLRVSEHISALLEVFKGTFVLEGATFRFLSNSIKKAYTDRGWDLEDTYVGGDELTFPTLQDVHDNLRNEINHSSYDAEVRGNLRGFLEVRLGSLMDLDAGEVFNVRISTLAPETWLTTSAIVELEVLPEEAKNFFVLLVCHYILESLRANPKGGIDALGNLMPVRHVVFIEEAHNIIAPSTEQAGADSVDPKISATKYIVKMLAEVRALREAIVIADQLPTALASQVTKNTGLKVVHRLTAKDDREQIGSAISATSLQIERMASFTSGRAFIYHERTLKPFEVQIAEWGMPKVNFDVTDDSQLYKNIWNLPVSVDVTKIAIRNWQNKHIVPLEEKVEQLISLLADPADAKEEQDYLKDVRLKKKELRKLRIRCQKIGKLWCQYCNKSHILYQEYSRALEYIDELIERLADFGDDS